MAGTESVNTFDISTRAGSKQGGVKKGDEVGGIHSGVFNKTAKVAALIKKDKEVEANISEFLGAAIFQATEPAYGARVFLTVPLIKKMVYHHQLEMKSITYVTRHWV
jgi:hypothetical protein